MKFREGDVMRIIVKDSHLSISVLDGQEVGTERENQRKEVKQNLWGRKVTEAAEFWNSVLSKRPEESTVSKMLFL